MSAVKKTGNFNNKHSLPWLQVVTPALNANFCGASSKIQQDYKYLEQESRTCKKTKQEAIQKKTSSQKCNGLDNISN